MTLGQDAGPSTLRTAKRIIVKIGSALVSEDGRPRENWLKGLASDIAAYRARDQEVILVSSGAIALGRGFLGTDRPKRLEEKQAAAALGQPLLMTALQAALRPHALHTAQALLTLDDTENRRRWLNARATLDTLLKAGSVPVINENDTIATDEIRYGDNDRLAARVAQMMSADVLILLSDIDGLYTADPRSDPDARHIPILQSLTADHDAMAGGINRSAGMGSGGMATKLMAARIAYAAGCTTVITLGDRPAPLQALHENAKATWIFAPETPVAARANWLKGHLTPEGAILVDDGARRALEGGASLLPVGVSAIEGRFERGAAVAVKASDGTVFAKGVTAYSSADATRLIGLQSEASETVLGFRGRPALIHRDDLVLIDP